ncbi:MAG TPA: ligand-binding protein, receptor family [Oribacterium sp.]|nr:ligand-binding protein, receptor family [Oribacterium sp.]HCS66733.1 ligand-binding protein, receptor family [Oribacterium sp.]
MKLKRLVSAFMAAAIAGSMLAGCGSTTTTTTETQATQATEAAKKETEAASDNGAGELTGEPIKIGAMYALSGDKAAIGTNIMRGVDFAAEEINAAGGVNGRPIEIVRGDTQGDPKVARSVAERLITQDKVNAIMGCHQSTLSEIVAKVCEQYKIPMITAISTVDSISTDNLQYFFRLCPLNSVYVEDMLKYLKDSSEQTGKEVKTVSIFADNSNIGQEIIRCVGLYADKYDIQVVKEVQYSSGAADLTSEVLALKEANADAVICESYIADAILFTKTLKEQNYQPPIIIGKANGFADPSYIPATGNLANGITTVVEFNPDLKKGVETNKKFKAEYDVDMNGHSAEAYTVVWLFKTAFEMAGTTDGEAVKNVLDTIDIKDSFPNGPDIILPYDEIKFEDYEFDGAQHTNDNTKASVAVAQIQDGEFKTVWPFDFTDSKIQYPAPLS